MTANGVLPMRYLVWNIRHMRADKIEAYKEIFKKQLEDIDVAFFLECKKNASAKVLESIVDESRNILSANPKAGYANCSHKDDEGVVWLCRDDINVTINTTITSTYANLGMGERYPVAFDVARGGNTEIVAIFHAEGPARQFANTKLNLLRAIPVDVLAGDFNFEPQEHLTLPDDNEIINDGGKKDDEDEVDDDEEVGSGKGGKKAATKLIKSKISKRSKRLAKFVMYLKEADGAVSSSTVNKKGNKTHRKRPIDATFIRKERIKRARVRMLQQENNAEFFQLSDHLPQKIEI